MRLSSETHVVSRAERRPGSAGAPPASPSTALELRRDRGARITAWRRGVALWLGAALLAGCNPLLQGNGVYLEETRTFPVAFEGVRCEEGVTTVVTVAEGEPQSVKVIGDANLVSGYATALADAGGLTILRVWVSLEDDYAPTIPPKVVVTVPAFSYVYAQDSTFVEVKRAPAATFTGGPLSVTLATATLDAGDYPAERASVALTGRGSARLHVDAPGEIEGTVAGEMALENAGTGPCNVTTSGAATVTCSQ
jgi:hypothetical protein